MNKMQDYSFWAYDFMDSNYIITAEPVGSVINFEMYKNKVKIAEVGVTIDDLPKLESIIKNFKNSQVEKKPKAKSGRKRIYEGKSETLSIHVPSEQKEFIKSVVDAILKPMQIKK